MRIGIAYDLKPKAALAGLPDDAFEEYDGEETVTFLAAALGSLGHQAVLLGGGRGFLERLQGEPVDLVWNLAEGCGGRCREAHIPAILEFLGVPYTHSDPLTLAATLDKAVAKRLVSQAGVATPPFTVAHTRGDISAAARLPGPLFVKPLDEGSSKGIRGNPICRNRGELEERVGWLLAIYGRPVLIESFVSGREITVGVIGNRVSDGGQGPALLGVMEVLPRGGCDPDFVYSLEVKRDFANRVSYKAPPDLPHSQLLRVEEAALAAYEALECRDVARIDFRLGEDGVPYFLEANPLPGLNPKTGDLPILARLMGIEHGELIRRILEAALGRLERASTRLAAVPEAAVAAGRI